jgi:ABC-type multidrug transport system fused ATPase/permease subunit
VKVSARTIALRALAIVAVGLVRAGGIVTRRYFAGMTGARMQASLRTRVIRRYRELPLAYHRAHPTGELLAHAQADIDAATEVIHPLPYSTAVILLIVFAAVARHYRSVLALSAARSTHARVLQQGLRGPGRAAARAQERSRPRQ